MIDIDFKFYLSLFWRRLPLFLLIWLTISCIGIATAYLLPSIYKSEATILVESSQISETLYEDTVNASSNEIIQGIQQRLLTRQNMLDIAERFNTLGNYPGYSPTERVELMRNSIGFEVLDLGNPQQRRGTPSATAFKVAFYSEDAPTTIKVANELMTQILEENRKKRGEIATKTKEFFKQEVDKLARQLTDLEGQIVNFKNENGDALPDSLEFRRSEMSRIQTRLLQLDSQELTLLEQKAELQRVIDNPALIDQVTTNRQLSPEERALLDLRRQLAQANAIYAETHPRVRQLTSEIESLEASINALDEDGNETIEGAGRLGQIRTDLGEVEANLRFIEQQRTDLEAQLATLAKSVEQTPNVEMQLNILNRRHEQLQSQYDLNLDRLNTASTGEEIEAQQQGERFEVIEQPSFPDEPVSPNRILIAAASLIGGIAAGAGIIVLLELLNTRIRRPVELVNRLGIQPFATVPYIPTRGEVFRRRLKAATSVLAVAICVPGALYLIHYYYMPIDLIISKVADRFGIDGLVYLLS